MNRPFRAFVAGAFLLVLVGVVTSVPDAIGDQSAPPTVVHLCDADEPGEPMAFSGRIFDMNGRPLSKAAVVAYNTDATGHYAPPGSGTRVPRLRAVAVTDDLGRFAFQTIRPAGYPGRTDPAHIHLTIAAPMHTIKHVTFWFEGDERITDRMRRRLDDETVIVTPQRRTDGVLTFTHDVRLSGN